MEALIAALGFGLIVGTFLGGVRFVIARSFR